MSLIAACYIKKEPMGKSLHEKAMNYFNQYMIVGGMPQVVDIYAVTNSFEAADKLKRSILETYRRDIEKSEGSKHKTEDVFDAIPGQLSKREKRFKLTMGAVIAVIVPISTAMPEILLSDALTSTPVFTLCGSLPALVRRSFCPRKSFPVSSPMRAGYAAICVGSAVWAQK